MPTGPQKLILIRSGLYEYAEVELAGALQIVGPNNTGKTTLINTLQFLYLDDRRHMDFGSYTPEQTREFYFPGQYSYLLFECLGATGQCVLGYRGQSKTSGGEPERFYHAGPFDPADFLDAGNQVREPREVNARLALKGYRALKSAQEQRELLLPASAAGGRGLGIVALRDHDKYHQFRETLKNLLTLSAITQEQMRDRLLMLADIPPARPAFDARALFGEDYDRIRARRDQLLKFKQQQPLVEQLAARFASRELARGELVWRWTDLRGKRQQFEREHEAGLAQLRLAQAEAERKINVLGAELRDRRQDEAAFHVEKGRLEAPLEELQKGAKEFAAFAEELERAALANLKKQIQALEHQLAEAEGESREKAGRKVAFYQDLVRDKEQTIARFGRLVVTALRKHFRDDELDQLFRLLSPALLELPVGEEGVELAQPEEMLARLRALLARIHEGTYREASVSFRLPGTRNPLAGLENPETAREYLREYRQALEHWSRVLGAIEQRERLERELQALREEVQGRLGPGGQVLAEGKERRLFRFEAWQAARAEEPRWRAELKKVEAGIAAAAERIARLTSDVKAAEKAQADARAAVVRRENAFNQVINGFEECLFPEFSTPARVAGDIPNDFEAAIALYLRQQESQAKLTNEVEALLRQTEAHFGDEFRGLDEAQTVGALRAELEALPEQEEALARDWNSHIHGMKATFDLALRNLEHLREAAARLNRAFAKVRVSNLKSVKVEIVEQSDLVSWIKRLAAFEPGGLFDQDPQQDAAIANFRRRIQDNPVIQLSHLFTIGFAIIGANDQRHHYHDFRQIESHGTTIAIKVLFNLLLLREQLRREDCAVPFFLDEIQTLDPANREAILRTARQLGFLAITAAPEAVSEVDALYFLQPREGRIVLRRKHRVAVRRPPALA